MQEGYSFAGAIAQMRQHTGVVIPVYFPEGQDNDLARELLEDNVHAYAQQVDDPESICLSVDGEGRGREVAEGLAREYGVQFVVAAENGGKLQALRHGMARLCARDELAYLAAVDMDGDHFANELLNLVRAAEHARRSVGMEEVLVLGRRSSKQRPLGFLRGELEELADRVLLDALAYDAAVSGVPLRLECATAVEEYPDFHSGYKLFSRRTAAGVFLSEPRLCGASADAYYRHGVEAVMSVEALKGGAHLVLVSRSALNEQPVSSFGLLNRERLVADKMIWPCRRLEIPPLFVDQWLRNHIPRLLLNTLVPQGKEELLQIRRMVLEGIDAAATDDLSWGPLFI
jgi:hypothetical protein